MLKGVALIIGMGLVPVFVKFDDIKTKFSNAVHAACESVAQLEHELQTFVTTL